MSAPIKITQTQARRIALHASPLYGQTKLPKGKEGVLAVIQKLGYTQIDTISVIERAHHHTLWTRCQDYKPEYLHQLQSIDKNIFEYWGHAMSYLPIDDYRFYKHSFKKFKDPSDKWSRMRLEKTRTLLPKILKRIKNEGALDFKDFEDTSGKKANGWWDFKPAKIALELLYWQGKLMVAERQNFHRKYDLAERVLPSHINTKNPTIKEQTQFWIYRALQSNGIATVSDIKKHLHYCDNAVINRDRLQKLFDFAYTIECYLPKPKRKYGYFVLLILWGDRFVGRLDAKADRKTKELIIHNIYVENDFQPTDSFTKSFRKKLQSFTKFNNCNSIFFRQSEANSFIQELNPII